MFAEVPFNLFQGKHCNFDVPQLQLDATHFPCFHQVEYSSSFKIV